MSKKFLELQEQTQSLAQQLHNIRISKRLTLEQVSCETKVPAYVIDAMELGVKNNISDLYVLAKYYGKRVQIQLVDRE